MAFYEYKVIPAPRKAVRTKGAKGFTARFSSALEIAMNQQAIQGWEYVRAETLPADERMGITRRKSETYQNVLVFRREADPTKMVIPTLIEENSDEIAEPTFSSDPDFADDFPEEPSLTPRDD